MIDTQSSALLLIDIQNDFCPGGALAVPEGDQVVTVANRLQELFQTIIATKDWHPKKHVSFASYHQKEIGEIVQLGHGEQILWPDHCVQENKGAEFHPELNDQLITKVIFKGSDPAIDSYSAFYDNAHLRSTGLDDYLKNKGIKSLYILGLATDYCVKYSVLDALSLGYEVYVVQDGCRGVNINPSDSELAFEELRHKGAHLINSVDLF